MKVILVPDARAQLEQLYSSDDANRALVDEVLMTATIFSVPLTSASLPANGSVIRITKSRKRMVYEGKKCQFVARVADIMTLTQQ